MTGALEVETTALLRHEHRTPINHIIGYSEILIEDCGESSRERFITVFERINKGGRELLELVQSAFGDTAGAGSDSGRAAFRTQLQVTASEMSRTVRSVTEDLERGHRQTLADVDAISWAIRRLLELAGHSPEVPYTGPDVRQAEAVRGIADRDRDNHPFPANRRAGRILIADDDVANRDLLRRRLECEGHEVLEAKTGLEVLEVLRGTPCDLVLLDIIMPVMDGFQTLAAMKQDAGFRELPVIMISVLDQLQDVARCIEMGAEDYLPKPFNRVLLRARIGASLEKKWLRDRERQKADELEKTLRLLEQTQEQLAMQASRDALTGLANRRSMEARLDFLVRQGMPFMAIFIDLNGFKEINDTWGHDAGDDLLRQVGARLRTAFRSTDVIGRWGGDEFVALGDVNLDIQSTVSRIRDCLTGEFVVSNGGGRHQIGIGAAIGAATWKPGDTATDLLRRADFAMYEEKLRSVAA